MSDNHDNRRRSDRIHQQEQEQGSPNYNPSSRGRVPRQGSQGQGYNPQQGGQLPGSGQGRAFTPQQSGQPSGGGQGQAYNPQQRGQPSGSGQGRAYDPQQGGQPSRKGKERAYNPQQSGQPSGSGQGRAYNPQQGGYYDSNLGSRQGFDGSDAGSRRGSNAGSQQGANSPVPGPARPVSQVPGDQPPSNVYQRGHQPRQSAPPAGNRSPDLQVLSRTPSPFQVRQPPPGNAEGAGPSRSRPRQPTVVAHGGPGRSVGGMYGTPFNTPVVPRVNQYLDDSDVEIDSDFEITGSQEVERPRPSPVPPRPIPCQLPARNNRSGRGRSQQPPFDGRTYAQRESDKLEVAGNRLARRTAIHAITMHIINSQHNDIFRNATQAEMEQRDYASVKAKVIKGIADGAIDDETLSRFDGKNPPDNGGGNVFPHGGRRGGGAGGAAGGAVSA